MLELRKATEIIQADRNHRWNNETISETERLLNEEFRPVRYEVKSNAIYARA